LFSEFELDEFSSKSHKIQSIERLIQLIEILTGLMTSFLI